MGSDGDSNVVDLETAQSALCKGFLGWQCRVRQVVVREHGGRPSSGMRPQVILDDDQRAISSITVLINTRDAEKTATQFRHMVRKTHDPVQRVEAALRYLSADYYQRAGDFTDLITALFALDSALCRRIIEATRCELDFEQTTHAYRIPCVVRELTETDPIYQATYWHNHLFNPRLPGKVRILGFRPDWSIAVQRKG